MNRCGHIGSTQRRDGGVGRTSRAGFSRAGAVATCLIALLGLLTASAPQEAVGQTPVKVGVAEFYAPTPLGDFFGLNPERFAAADLSDSLARAASGKFAIIPRATVEQSEVGMQWHGVDALHFDRLGALAHAVGADWIVTGWIKELVIQSAGRPGSDVPILNGPGQKLAYAAIVVQTFSAAEGRIVGQTTQYGSTTTGELRSDIAMRVLHDTLQPTVPWIMNAVTEQIR